ncbi:MAG: hypothetical protein HOD60_15525 [Candidatus Nitrosopelagicus sp.]|mgnify:FL=1|jgi:hypothetical protein|nr:hypothetical protein [Candidatus Nitrosopelagicus sp.]
MIEKIIQRLKLEYYIPQRNKAEGKARYYEMCVFDLESKNQNEKLTNRLKARLDYDRYMKALWYEELVKINLKISRIEDD